MDEELLEEFRELFDFDVAKKNVILNKIISDEIITGDKIDISDDVYKDTCIDKWVTDLPVLDGSKILISKLIKHPINNKDILLKRQKAFIDYEIDIDILKNYESDVLWIYKIADEINENSSIEILFPSSFIISYINYFEFILDTYHLYKIYFIPITSILYPISTFVAPYYYIRSYMKIDISFTYYLKTMYFVLSILFKPSGNFRQDVTKFVTFILYIGIYLYNMYQTYEIAKFLYDTKYKLHAKMEGLVHFIKHSLNITSNISKNILDPYFAIDNNYNDLIVNNSMTDIYRIWKDDNIKSKISSLLKTIYGIDVLYSINNLLLDGKWSIAKYTNNTILWDARNPILNYEQVSNPIKLNKNIIVTGPNAGGKTTYVKTILSNVILSQTFGITYSLRSEMMLYDTINSFMRVSDELGNKSYFEAEAEYCLNMIKKAKLINQENKKGLFLMDEPMHSTPPTEGMATAYAVVEYLSKIQGISLIITTHFHKLVKLAEFYPNKFINLSVDAIPTENNIFYFPYKIKNGYSYLCIAIELLDIKDFPKEIINNAIKMKNKICFNINK